MRAMMGSGPPGPYGGDLSDAFFRAQRQARASPAPDPAGRLITLDPTEYTVVSIS